MLNILVNAYAVSPNWGSEPGLGWNWIANLSKYCNLFVITEGEWKKEIEEKVAELPQRDNIHFFFNPVSPEIRKMCWNQGDWRFYKHYRDWQNKSLDLARQIIADNHIDVIHQLNMIGFREPGSLWKIKEIPFVWGPVGGVRLDYSQLSVGAAFRREGESYREESDQFASGAVLSPFQQRHETRRLRARRQFERVSLRPGSQTQGCDPDERDRLLCEADAGEV